MEAWGGVRVGVERGTEKERERGRGTGWGRGSDIVVERQDGIE